MDYDPHKLRALAAAIEDEKAGHEWLDALVEQSKGGAADADRLLKVVSRWGTAVAGCEQALAMISGMLNRDLERNAAEAKKILTLRRVSAVEAAVEEAR